MKNKRRIEELEREVAELKIEVALLRAAQVPYQSPPFNPSTRPNWSTWPNPPWTATSVEGTVWRACDLCDKPVNLASPFVSQHTGCLSSLDCRAL